MHDVHIFSVFAFFHHLHLFRDTEFNIAKKMSSIWKNLLIRDQFVPTRVYNNCGYSIFFLRFNNRTNEAHQSERWTSPISYEWSIAFWGSKFQMETTKGSDTKKKEEEIKMMEVQSRKKWEIRLRRCICMVRDRGYWIKVASSPVCHRRHTCNQCLQSSWNSISISNSTFR